MSIQEIKRIFERINATSYSLNAMEVHNSRFDGELKRFADEVAKLPFFSKHRIFSVNDIRRMRDLSYVLVIIISVMSGYFNRDDELETYLRTYNDEFEMKDYLDEEIKHVFGFIDFCDFGLRSRAWKKSDFLNLVVEIYHILFKEQIEISPAVAGSRIKAFYEKADKFANKTLSTAEIAALLPAELTNIGEYVRAAIQATNDRGSRVRRGKILHDIILDKKEIIHDLWSDVN